MNASGRGKTLIGSEGLTPWSPISGTAVTWNPSVNAHGPRNTHGNAAH